MFEEVFSNNVTTGLVFGVIGLLLWASFHRPKGIPPGPLFTLPVVGNLLQIEKNPLTTFKKMRAKYGDVFSMYIGNYLVVVINGYDNIKEMFVKNGEVSTGRPANLVRRILSGSRGIIIADGHTWKEQRKFALRALRTFGTGQTLDKKIQEEIKFFMEELYNRREKPTDIGHLIHNAVSNVICSIVFGKRFEYKDPKFLKLLKALQEDICLSYLADFMPYLRFLPGDLLNINRTISNVEMTARELIIPLVEEHQRNYDKDNIDNFVSAYIQEIKLKESTGEKTSMDRQNLLSSIGDLFLGGTETPSTAIRWLILYFLYFPEIQEKCFSEIESVVGCSRPVTLKDKTQLPYVEASILETLRVADIASLAGPHTAAVDMKFKGYKIPKDSIILPNLDSVLSDPKIWGDPENFRPERYIDEEGKIVKPEEYIPFFVGRRNCIGESMARMELFLFISNMIQKFKFVKVDGDTLPSLEGEFGLTHFPKSYELRIIPRD